ncbi:sigma-54 interaction domain-containing protein [Desulfitobacterium sp. Sab5]|uniref:sigma-54 interaction domain-containing protein n=1 Tax=Desulfitobacterium TaxID=36853 RepID=UPI003CFA8B23
MEPNWQQEILATFNWQPLLADIILAVDQTGQIIYASNRRNNPFGELFVNIEGRKITDILPNTKILNVLISGEPLVCPEIGPQGDRWAAHYFPWLQENKLVGAMAFFVRSESIAGVRDELEAYSLVNTMYEAALDDVAVGILLINREGKIIFANHVSLELLNLKNQGSILFHHLADSFPQIDVRRVLKTGLPSELKLIHLAEEEVFVRITPLFHKEELLGAAIKFIPKDNAERTELMDQLHLLTSRLDACKRELRGRAADQSPFWSVIGECGSMKKLKRLAERVSKGEATILLTGESGTGKGVFAQAIHNSSSRSEQAFIPINCAAIPENLLESELFGYEEGAFTGAVKGGRVGRLEMANHGTLFLDEIGDMPLAMQAKILRVLQERSFERVGGRKTIHVDVRVIAATNKDLQQLIQEGKFRLDLFYRLSVINIHLPPLRDRGQDVLLLVSRIIENLNQKYGMEVDGIHPKVERLFLENSWPGNIRQLENILEYAFNMLREDEFLIDCEHLPDEFCRDSKHSSRVCMVETIAQAEKEAIIRAIRQSGGNKKEAAKLLGIPRSSLYEKINKLGLKGLEI